MLDGPRDDADKKELDKLEPAPEITALLVNGDAAAIRSLANNKTTDKECAHLSA